MNITLYGAASDRIDQKYVNAVEAFGTEMAQRGHAMVFGAGSTGLMGAAARGMHRGGGSPLGIDIHYRYHGVCNGEYACEMAGYRNVCGYRKPRGVDLR